MKRLFHNNLTLSPGGTVDHQDRDSSSSSGQQSQQKLAENEAATFRHAITLHPVKSVAAMRRLVFI
jgi:hypothetical protein